MPLCIKSKLPPQIKSLILSKLTRVAEKHPGLSTKWKQQEVENCTG
jgi:hypothetical protein